MNIRKIAMKAGVSIASVSRYINGSGKVSPTLAKKIQAVIDDTGYMPNELARSLFRNSSNMIGVLIPNVSNPFFGQILLYIEKYASSHGYNIFLCNTYDDIEIEKRHIVMLQQLRVDGMVVMRGQNKDIFSNIKVPIVSLENNINPNIPMISVDNYLGGAIAFHHLYHKGCKNLLHIAGPNRFEATVNRCQGFIDSAKEYHIPVDIIRLDSDFKTSFLENYFDKFDLLTKYDGVFVFNDITAATVLKYFVTKGKNIPNDIKLIGFDDNFISELLYPTLTTIHQPIEKMSKLLVDKLIKRIQNKSVEEQENKDMNTFLLPPKLIERETTR